MFNLIFGIVWTIFTSFFALIMLGSMFSINNINGHPGGISFNFNPELLIPVLIISVFFIVGIVLIVSGLKIVIKDFKTKKHGIICYGIVQNIQTTGAYMNEQPEYKAILDVINPNTNQVEKVEEIIGFNYNKYPIGSYVVCKYYEGDINFENKIEPGEVPSSYKDLLKPITYTSSVDMPYTDIEFSEDREYVTIDGVKYKKVF